MLVIYQLPEYTGLMYEVHRTVLGGIIVLAWQELHKLV